MRIDLEMQSAIHDVLSSMPRISLLDLIPLTQDQTPHDALRDARELVLAADRLGYHRYWVAEHHNTRAIASTSPAVTLAWLGADTERIRLGSGGVMLPNHAPFVVAEQFALLEAMYPNRIDLGLGRAPGTDPVTAAALRRDTSQEAVERYPSDVVEIMHYLDPANSTVTANSRHRLRAAADIPHAPEFWLLGSSLYSAELAGMMGLPYAYANHFNMGGDAMSAANHYRRHFRASARYEQPQFLVSASVVVAGTEAEAQRLDMTQRVSRFQLLAGKLDKLLSPEAAAEFATEVEHTELWQRSKGNQYVGTAETVRRGLDELVERTGADELLVAINAYSLVDRLETLSALAPLQQ